MTRRFRLTGPLRDPVRLAAALQVLVPDIETTQVDWLLRQERFDVCAVLRSDEETRLRELLEACGPRSLAVLEGGDVPPTGWRLAIDALAATKAGVTFAAGAGTLAFGVPLVPIAAAAMFVLLAVRAVRLEPLEMTIPREKAAELLAAVDPRVASEARIAVRDAADDAARMAMHACVDALTELAKVTRAGCAHIVQPELGRVDASLALLTRWLGRVAATPRGSSRTRLPAHAGPYDPYRVGDTADHFLTNAAGKITGLSSALAASGDAAAALAALEALKAAAARTLAD